MGNEKTENETTEVTASEEHTVDENEFYGTPENSEEPAVEEQDDEPEVEEVKQESEEETEEDTPEEKEEVEEAEETETSEEEDDSPEDKPKPKTNRFQERINDLTAKFREAERRAQEAEAKLAEKSNTKQDDTDKSKSDEDITVYEADAPQPTDKTEDGEDKYPLGEFDPQYIKDLMRHTLDTESKVRAAEEKKAEQEAKEAEVRQALTEKWNENVTEAKTRYEDFQEKGESLLSTFEGMDEAYADYLSSTLMAMDHGADVLYHLANNPDEAEAIVNSGATNATLALGRIEARFVSDANVDKQKVTRTTQAKAPPPQNKGSNAAQVQVAPDTDDLDAFEKMFNKGR